MNFLLLLWIIALYCVFLSHVCSDCLKIIEKASKDHFNLRSYWTKLLIENVISLFAWSLTVLFLVFELST